MNVLAGSSNDKPIMIEFGCGLTPLSFDRKLTLQADTGADSNPINKKTFNEVFPDVKLEESTYVLQNFDKRLTKPIGSLRCFLRWKGHKYRVKFEVMGIDTPNLLSRETTFLMGILKKCLTVEKASNNPIFPTSVSEQPVPSTEGVLSHSVPPTDMNLLASMDSLTPTEDTPLDPIKAVPSSNIPSLSITDLSLPQEKVESTYADVFQGLGKIPR